MPSVIQRRTESFRITSMAPVDVPATFRRKVPAGRWVLREGFSTERTRIPPTTPATQRRTCSLGNAAVCAPPSPSMKRSITAKLSAMILGYSEIFHNEHDGAVHLALTGRMLRDAEVHPGSVQT